MIKISTSDSSLSDNSKKNDAFDGEIVESFYQSIKPKMDALIKNPSQETILNILAYAKRP